MERTKGYLWNNWLLPVFVDENTYEIEAAWKNPFSSFLFDVCWFFWGFCEASKDGFPVYIPNKKE